MNGASIDADAASLVRSGCGSSMGLLRNGAGSVAFPNGIPNGMILPHGRNGTKTHSDGLSQTAWSEQQPVATAQTQ